MHDITIHHLALPTHDGRVVAHKYGTHADDEWSVDELLSHATGR